MGPLKANEPWVPANFPVDTPRSVRPTGLTIAFRIVPALIIVGVLVGGGMIGSGDVRELRQLAQQGKRVSGHVTDKRITRGQKEGQTFWLDYEYRLSGETVQSSEAVSNADYTKARVGDAIRLTALPARPAVHRIGTVDRDQAARHARGWTLGTLGFVAQLALFTAIVQFLYRREARRIQRDELIPAVVEANSRTHSRNRDHRIDYQYEYGGTIYRRKGKVPERIGKSLAIGQSVPCLVRSDQPGAGKLLAAFQLAKIA